MKWLSKEIGIFFLTIILCYIAHKFECYNAMIIYLGARIYVEMLDKEE